MQSEKQFHKHELKAVIGANGSLNLHGLPFAEGEEVQVIVLDKSSSEATTGNDDSVAADAANHKNLFPYHGLPYRYEDPFEPAAPPEEWEVYR